MYTNSTTGTFDAELEEVGCDLRFHDHIRVVGLVIVKAVYLTCTDMHSVARSHYFMSRDLSLLLSTRKARDDSLRLPTHQVIILIIPPH